MKNVLLGFGTFALAVASAASSYHVTLFEKSVIGGTQLKPGEYRIEVKDNKAIVKNGKEVASADVRVETADQKFRTTTIRYDQAGKVQEIRVGGTATRLVFNEAGAGN